MANYISVSSLEDYIRKISKRSLEVGPHANFLFRGHKNHKYDAIPSVFRDHGYSGSEQNMLRDLLASQPEEFNSDSTTFEKLVRAQHYGLPTRLLDVSRNPLVALYFACEYASETLANGMEREVGGEVILFLPSAKKRKYFDSDTVACLSNLALLNQQQRDSLKKHALISRELAEQEHPKDAEKFVESMIAHFRNHDEVDRLVHLVSIERPGFSSRINPLDLANVVYVQPRVLHKRLAAQDGAFLIYGLFSNLSEHLFIDNIESTEIRIPPNKKERILNDLSRLGINDGTLFPEIDRAAGQIKLRYQS